MHDPGGDHECWLSWMFATLRASMAKTTKVLKAQSMHRVPPPHVPMATETPTHPPSGQTARVMLGQREV